MESTDEFSTKVTGKYREAKDSTLKACSSPIQSGQVEE